MIVFVPPDGEFDLMKYRVADIPPLFKVEAMVDSYKVCLRSCLLALLARLTLVAFSS